MNCDTLLDLCEMVDDELVGNGVIEFLDMLHEHATTLGTSPDATAESGFQETLEALSSNLALERGTNTVGPMMCADLIAIDAYELTGRRLANRLEGIVSQSPFLPNNVAKAIIQLRAEVAEIQSKVNVVSKQLRAFGFEGQSSKPRDLFEFAVGIPNETVALTVGDVAGELKQWDSLFQTIGECANGTAASPPLASAEVGSFEFSLAIDTETMLVAGVIIAKLLDYLSWRSTTGEKRAELEDLNFPDEIVDAIKLHESDQRKKAIAEAVDKALKEVGDKSRRNELRTKLTKEVTWQLERLEAGVEVDIRSPSDEFAGAPDRESDLGLDLAKLPDDLREALRIASAKKAIGKAEMRAIEDKSRADDQSKTAKDDSLTDKS